METELKRGRLEKVVEDEENLRLGPRQLLRHLQFKDSYRDALMNAGTMQVFAERVCGALMREFSANYARMLINYCDVDLQTGNAQGMPDVGRLNPPLQARQTRLGKGQYSYMVRVLTRGRDELGAMALGMSYSPNIAAIRRFQDIARATELHINNSLNAFVHLDLGVYRKEVFEQHLDHAVRSHLETLAPYSLLMLDIDHFKSVNDNHDHKVGDEAIKHVVSLVKHCIRRKDLFGRVGGDEFCVFLDGIDSSRAYSIAQRVCSDVKANPMKLDCKELPLTVSVGVTGSDVASYASAEEALRAVDSALYLSKRSGRDRATRAYSQ